MSGGPAVPVRLDPAAAGESGTIAAEKVVAGGPVSTETANLFTDRYGRFHCGFWRSSPGCWRVSYAEDELCTLLEGRVRLVADGGGSWTYGAGETFVIPAGFAGTWESLEPVRKLYVIHETSAAV